MAKRQPNFWHQGIRFECQRTGKCCTAHGEYGHVYLTLEDRRRIAAHLGQRTDVFTRTHCTKSDGFFHLNHPEHDCAFLRENQCTIYPARPAQCRSWPFCPENMDSIVWEQEIVPFCPGIGRGPLLSAAQIEARIRACEE